MCLYIRVNYPRAKSLMKMCIFLLTSDETSQTLLRVSVRRDKEAAQAETMLWFSRSRAHSLGKMDRSLGISFRAQSTEVDLSFPSSPGNARVFNLSSVLMRSLRTSAECFMMKKISALMYA